MEHSFWHDKWEQNDLRFHQPNTNALLIAHLKTLDLSPEACVFVPLCGKTLDIHWLHAQGYRVTGAELSELAIQQLFQDLDIDPTVTSQGPLKRLSLIHI